tara:strand:- start:420 stop:899 length:480 start_codon:yes stop_codon:yes gene_type:complete
MKITKSKLKQIIKEELQNVLEQLDDEDPLVRQALGPAFGMGPEDPEKLAPEEPELRASIPGVGDDVPVTASGEAIGQGQKQAAAERRAAKAAAAARASKSNTLRNAKARMRRARAAVRAELRKPENKGKNIYDLPKTKGSPRLEFARAYTALKRAKKRM